MSSMPSATNLPDHPSSRLRKRPRHSMAEIESASDNESQCSEEAPNSGLRRALDALNGSGFDSVASLLDSMLDTDSLEYTECRRMLFALLRHEKNQPLYHADQEFCCEVSSHATRIVANEMDALVSHKASRLPASQVNLENLDRFDRRSIAEHQQSCAPMITSILHTCAGSQEDTDQEDIDTNPPEVEVDLELGDASADVPPSCRDRKLIATISLCMLCYARNHHSNLLQMTAGYFAYAENTSKRMVNTLHRMGLLVTYETLRRSLKGYPQTTMQELKQKAWDKRFFLSFLRSNRGYRNPVTNPEK